MADYYVTYRDLEDYEPRRSFEMMAAPPAESVLTFEVLPPTPGWKALYIRWYRGQVGADRLYLVTYTHEELTVDEVTILLNQAYRFVQERN